MNGNPKVDKDDVRHGNNNATILTALAVYCATNDQYAQSIMNTVIMRKVHHLKAGTYGRKPTICPKVHIQYLNNSYETNTEYLTIIYDISRFY